MSKDNGFSKTISQTDLDETDNVIDLSPYLRREIRYGAGKGYSNSHDDLQNITVAVPGGIQNYVNSMLSSSSDVSLSEQFAAFLKKLGLEEDPDESQSEGDDHV